MKAIRLAVAATILGVSACSQQSPEQALHQANARTAPSANEQVTSQDVTFAATTSDFAVVSTATGKLSSFGPFASVALDQHTMRANPKYKAPARVLGHKIGLAFNRPDGQWDIARWSDVIPQDVVLSPGDTRQVEDSEFTIPIDNLPSLKGYWLVLAVELDINGSAGSTYAHSNKGIF